MYFCIDYSLSQLHTLHVTTYTVLSIRCILFVFGCINVATYLI